MCLLNRSDDVAACNTGALGNSRHKLPLLIPLKPRRSNTALDEIALHHLHEHRKWALNAVVDALKEPWSQFD